MPTLPATARVAVLSLLTALLILTLPGGAALAQAAPPDGGGLVPANGDCRETAAPGDHLFKDNLITYLSSQAVGVVPPRHEEVAYMTATAEWCSDGRTFTWGPHVRGRRALTAAADDEGQWWGTQGALASGEGRAGGALRVFTLESQFMRNHTRTLEAAIQLGVEGGIDVDDRLLTAPQALQLEIAVSPAIDARGYSSVACRSTHDRSRADRSDVGPTRCHRNGTDVPLGPPDLTAGSTPRPPAPRTAPAQTPATAATSWSQTWHGTGVPGPVPAVPSRTSSPAATGYPVCDALRTWLCIQPGSVDSSNPASVGSLRVGSTPRRPGALPECTSAADWMCIEPGSVEASNPASVGSLRVGRG